MRVPPKLGLLWAGALGGGAGLGSLGGDSTEPASRISFLAVGQGDCTVIRHAGATILVDVGPANEHFSAGSRIIARKLRQMGVRQVDLLILTHPDKDHIGGLPGLASRVSIRKVAAPVAFREHPELLATLEEAELDRGRVQWLGGEMSLSLGRLHGFIRVPPLPSDGEDNDGSPFIKMQIGESSCVLTGDAGEEAEAAQLGRADWRADVLKAGHHGSATSSSLGWLRRVSPTLVVVSCGADNPFGHPAPATLERVRTIGAMVFRTDKDGDIHLEPSRDGFRRVER